MLRRTGYMDSKKERVPGKLFTAGILMVIDSILTLAFLMFILWVPFIILLIFDIPIPSQADFVIGGMYTSSGARPFSPLSWLIMTLAVFILLVLLIVYYSSLMVHGFGMMRGRLTRKPPYALAIISFITMIIPPYGGVQMLLKIMTGVFMLVAFKDPRVRELYQRARDPSGASWSPQMERPSRQKVVSAIVVD